MLGEVPSVMYHCVRVTLEQSDMPTFRSMAPIGTLFKVGPFGRVNESV